MNSKRVMMLHKPLEISTAFLEKVPLANVALNAGFRDLKMEMKISKIKMVVGEDLPSPMTI